ncbi:helix-turn-helix transcriptional regulator [Streptomyces sp. NPDC004227]
METPSPTYQVDGADIRKRRMEAGLSTAELAEEAQISRRYLNHLENGYRTRMRPGSYSRLRIALERATGSDRICQPPDHPPETR